MESLLTRYKNGACVWDTDLPYLVEVLTARMDYYVPNIDVVRRNILNRLRAVPIVERTLQVCCDIVLENL